MNCVVSCPLRKPPVAPGGCDGYVTPAPAGVGSPARKTCVTCSTGGVTSIVTGTLALVTDPPGYARIAVTVAPPSARPVPPMLSVAANSADPAGADPPPVPINTPAA